MFLWDVSTGEILAHFSAPEDFVLYSLAFLKDDNQAITCGDDGMVRIWQLPDETRSENESTAIDTGNK
jgi:WD40 repeat protein